MKLHYDYFGWKYSRHIKLVWGIVRDLDSPFWDQYIFWGSTGAPIIRKNHFSKSGPTLKSRVDKRRLYYTEIPSNDVNIEFPEVESHILQHFMLLKLKYG